MDYIQIIKEAKHRTALSSPDRFVKISEREDRSDVPIPVWLTFFQNTYLQTWKGIILNKGISEIATYPMLLYELQPKTIIEIGSLNGGSALWFADNLEIMGLSAEIYGVDINLDLLDEQAKARAGVHFLQGDCNHLDQVLPTDLLARLPHPWLVIDDVHINTIGVCDYFHTHGLQPGDYFIVEDTNPAVWTFWGDQPWKEEEEIRHGVEKLNNLRTWLNAHEEEYLLDTHYLDLFGYNGSKNWNSILKRV